MQRHADLGLELAPVYGTLVTPPGVVVVRRRMEGQVILEPRGAAVVALPQGTPPETSSRGGIQDACVASLALIPRDTARVLPSKGSPTASEQVVTSHKRALDTLAPKMKKQSCDDVPHVRHVLEDGEQGLLISHLADHVVDVHVVARRARRADHLWRGARCRERSDCREHILGGHARRAAHLDVVASSRRLALPRKGALPIPVTALTSRDEVNVDAKVPVSACPEYVLFTTHMTSFVHTHDQ